MKSLRKPYRSYSWPHQALSSDLFADFFGRWEDSFGSVSNSLTREQGFQLNGDISETKTHYLMSFDVPGVNKEDININTENGYLTVSGKREKEINEEQEGVVHYERSYGSFSRSFKLPTNSDLDQTEASYENGVLNIAIPKQTKESGRNIEIQSGKSGFFSKLVGGKNKDTSDTN